MKLPDKLEVLDDDARDRLAYEGMDPAQAERVRLLVEHYDNTEILRRTDKHGCGRVFVRAQRRDKRKGGVAECVLRVTPRGNIAHYDTLEEALDTSVVTRHAQEKREHRDGRVTSETADELLAQPVDHNYLVPHALRGEYDYGGAPTEVGLSTWRIQASQDPAEHIERNLGAAMLGPALRALGERERTIMAMRFGIGLPRAMTLGEVGEHMGVSRERIRQIETQALRKLRLRMLGMTARTVEKRAHTPKPPLALTAHQVALVREAAMQGVTQARVRLALKVSAATFARMLAYAELDWKTMKYEGQARGKQRGGRDSHPPAASSLGELVEAGSKVPESALRAYAIASPA